MTSKEKFHKLMENRYVYLDGAMGTMLQKNGLKLGERPDLVAITSPETVIGVHKMYIEAGSNITYTNTFGANARKLQGSGFTVNQVVTASVNAAKKAAEGTHCLLALDVGPIGELMEPLGTLKFEEAYDIFKEMIIAGAEAGVDLIAIETMTDLYEVKAAVLAAKENSDLPVIVTMSFEADGRTFTGCSIEAMAATLEGMGINAMGINCGLGPDEILPMARELAAYTELPIVIKANAGLPDPETGEYATGPAEFASSMKEYRQLGIKFAGGCCGTSPEYIRELREAMEQTVEAKSPAGTLCSKVSRVCTPTKVVRIDGVHVIGERINPTGKKKFQQALRDRDLAYITGQAVSQVEAGADILDINVGIPGIDEAETMELVVKAVQAAVDVPLQIDSSDPAAIEAGLRACRGKAIVNSVNGDREVLESVLPIVKKYGAAVVGLTLDKNGIPETAEARFAIAKRIMEAALAHGITKENIFIDCLTLTVSAQQNQAMETLNALGRVKEELGLHTVLGVSNISFGMPARELVNRTFLTMAMTKGLDLPIINPNSEAMMDTVAAFKVLTCQDRDSGAFIERFKDRPAAVSSTSSASSGTAARPQSGRKQGQDGSGTTMEAAPETPAEQLYHAIIKGYRDTAGAITSDALAVSDEMTVINDTVIPALDQVGMQFEKGEIFLPQLINSANTAQEAFGVIRQLMAGKGETPVARGSILLATVKGDVHDIGKNIVKVVLESYGFGVTDLGKDVTPEAIAQAAIASEADIVGLSALMTTTLKSMEETVKLLRAEGYKGKTIIGGAVVTADYAESIGADFYSADARAAAELARQIIK